MDRDVQRAHAHGLALNAKGEDGGQAIHEAAFGGHLELVQWLHERGVPLDVTSGIQPIDCALKNHHQAVVKWLRERGCVPFAS